MFKKDELYRNRSGDIVKIIHTTPYSDLCDCEIVSSDDNYKIGFVYNFWTKTGSRKFDKISEEEFKNKKYHRPEDVIEKLNPLDYPELLI